MNNQMELWTEMWDFPNYEISDHGNIRSKKYMKNLSVRQDGREYRMVMLWGGGKKHNKRVGRYVWMSFNKCFCSKTINHINGNAGDDRLTNLECISMEDNIKAAAEKRKLKKKNKYNLSNRDKGYIWRSLTNKTETTWTIMKKYGIPLNYLMTTHKRNSWERYKDDY